MVNVTNRPYVAVRLITIKFFLRHFPFFLCSAGVPPATALNQYRILFFATGLFVIRAQKLLFLNQSIGKNPVSETLVVRLKLRTKTFKVSVPSP
jgi:hypothetical protein